MEGEYEDTSDIKKYLELIETSCDTMGNLITDITEIARIGKIENNIQNLNTYEIIQSAKTLVFGRLKDRNVELKVPNHLPSIAGDKNRMIQVFENLMDNAVKYMGNQKTPVIEIGVNENKDTNQFFVRDNGSGMDENALKYLFTPFMRFDDSVEGTGLGLYMISQIIQSHEGFITASSGGLGKGSTFTVKLPLVTIAQSQLNKKKSCEKLFVIRMYSVRVYSGDCSYYEKRCAFFFNDTATTEIYTLSLHDALPIYLVRSGSAPSITSAFTVIPCASSCTRTRSEDTRLNSSHPTRSRMPSSA